MDHVETASKNIAEEPTNAAVTLEKSAALETSKQPIASVLSSDGDLSVPAFSAEAPAKTEAISVDIEKIYEKTEPNVRPEKDAATEASTASATPLTSPNEVIVPPHAVPISPLNLHDLSTFPSLGIAGAEPGRSTIHESQSADPVTPTVQKLTIKIPRKWLL